MPLTLIVVAGVVGWLVTEAAYGQLPLLPWTAIPTLFMLALGEIMAAVHTRRRIRRAPGARPVEPLSVARLLALGKASAVVGALITGTFAGMAVALLDMLRIPTPRADAITAVGTMLAGLLLLVAALMLEYACRVPDDPKRDGAPGPGRYPSGPDG